MLVHDLKQRLVYGISASCTCAHLVTSLPRMGASLGRHSAQARGRALLVAWRSAGLARPEK